MKILLIATVFGLLVAHHKGRRRGHDDDDEEEEEEDVRHEGQQRVFNCFTN